MLEKCDPPSKDQLKQLDLSDISEVDNKVHRKSIFANFELAAAATAPQEDRAPQENQVTDKDRVDRDSSDESSVDDKHGEPFYRFTSLAFQHVRQEDAELFSLSSAKCTRNAIGTISFPCPSYQSDCLCTGCARPHNG